MSDFSVGRIIKGTVTGIESYGIFVSCDEYYSGLIHISEISDRFVSNIYDYVNIGDTIFCEIVGVDNKLNKLRLSIKHINYKNKLSLNRNKLKETSLGFKTLGYKLPIWIEMSLKKIKKVSNNVDK